MMFGMVRFCLLLLAGVLAAGLLVPEPSSAAVERRYALVVGNGDYSAIPGLTSPANDASDIGVALAKAGFEVTYGIDLDLREFWSIIQKFSALSRDGSAVVFYYAGHGFQLQSTNYLVPVDAALKTRESIAADNIDLRSVISLLQRDGRATVIMLDACRNSPLPEQLRDNDRQQGLMEVETGRDVFVTFATAPGQTAGDGIGRNSPFAQALLNHIRRPGLAISEMMVDLRRDVFTATEGKQVPWDQSSLRRQFYFVPTRSVAENIADSAGQQGEAAVEAPPAPETVVRESVIATELPAIAPEQPLIKKTTPARLAPVAESSAPAPQQQAALTEEETEPEAATPPPPPEKVQNSASGSQAKAEKRKRQREIEAANARKKQQAAKRSKDRSRTAQAKVSRGNRPSARTYSFQIWRSGIIPHGTVRKSTPYGTLVCKTYYSGYESTENRTCRWD